MSTNVENVIAQLKANMNDVDKVLEGFKNIHGLYWSGDASSIKKELIDRNAPICIVKCMNKYENDTEVENDIQQYGCMILSELIKNQPNIPGLESIKENALKVSEKSAATAEEIKPLLEKLKIKLPSLHHSSTINSASSSSSSTPSAAEKRMMIYRPNLLIFTTKAVETSSVLRLLSHKDIKPEEFQYPPSFHSAWHFIITDVSGCEVKVVLVEIGAQGPESSAAFTMLALNLIKPRAVALLGMCAGNKDEVNLYDVVLGYKAYQMDEGVMQTNGTFKSDGRSSEIPSQMKKILENTKAKTLSVNLPNSFKSYEARIKTGVYLSGSTVIENSSIKWKDYPGDIMAYEMEASGFLTACNLFNEHNSQRDQVEILGVFKGVADFGDPEYRKNIDKKEAQLFATTNAFKTLIYVAESVLLRSDHAKFKFLSQMVSINDEEKRTSDLYNVIKERARNEIIRLGVEYIDHMDLRLSVRDRKPPEMRLNRIKLLDMFKDLPEARKIIESTDFKGSGSGTKLLKIGRITNKRSKKGSFVEDEDSDETDE